MRARSWLLLSGLVLISPACGGRSVDPGDDYGDGATNAGGKATGTGGKATGSGGKATGVGGKTTGVGATSSVGGGGPLCTDIPCLNIACGPNQVRVPTPDGCCEYCLNTCPPCSSVACGSGSHLEIPPGACCATCVQDSCADQLEGYQQLRSQLLDKYGSLGCMVNADCTTWYEKNNCKVGCGMAMPVAGIGNLESNLQSYAQQNCSPSCMVGTPGCAPSASPVCVKGQCL